MFVCVTNCRGGSEIADWSISEDFPIFPPGSCRSSYQRINHRISLIVCIFQTGLSQKISSFFLQDYAGPAIREISLQRQQQSSKINAQYGFYSFFTVYCRSCKTFLIYADLPLPGVWIICKCDTVPRLTIRMVPLPVST